jgi:hypothetical protein
MLGLLGSTYSMPIYAIPLKTEKEILINTINSTNRTEPSFRQFFPFPGGLITNSACVFFPEDRPIPCGNNTNRKTLLRQILPTAAFIIKVLHCICTSTEWRGKSTGCGKNSHIDQIPINNSNVTDSLYWLS